MEKKQTAVEWLIDEIEKLISITNFPKWETLKKQAKQIENIQHGNTWDDAIQAHEDRGHNLVRSWCDFDDYFTKTYGDDTNTTDVSVQNDVIKSDWDIEKFFEALRFNEKTHLGLGDIRLTIGAQEEVCELVKRFYRKK